MFLSKNQIVFYKIMADEKFEKFVLEEDQELRISTQENDEENIEIEMVYGTGKVIYPKYYKNSN